MAERSEIETVIQFDDASPNAVVYTHHNRWKRHLKGLGLPVIHDNHRGGLTFHVPKAWVRLPLRPRTRPLSEAMRAQRAAAMRTLRETGKLSRSKGKTDPF